MRRIIVALLVGATVSAGVYAAAASLTVASNTLGAGNTAVAACQSGTLTAQYATSYASALPGYKVGVLTVAGLDTVTVGTNCASKAFKITLTGTGNTSLAEVTGTTPASGTTFTADFSASNIKAADVLGVHVVISG
jgi:hypothetical protein